MAFCNTCRMERDKLVRSPSNKRSLCEKCLGKILEREREIKLGIHPVKEAKDYSCTPYKVEYYPSRDNWLLQKAAFASKRARWNRDM